MGTKKLLLIRVCNRKYIELDHCLRVMLPSPKTGLSIAIKNCQFLEECR
jgi:hypothetical protein